MSRSHSGGTLADIGCHILDFTTYVVGDISSLQCSMKSFPKGVPRNTWKGYQLDADDSFFATAEFASGALGVIHATRWATGHANCLRLRVFGDHGAPGGGHRRRRRQAPGLPGEIPRPEHAVEHAAGEACRRSRYYARFIRTIRSGKREAPTFEDGVRGRAYQDACIASAETGKPVRIR